MDQAEVDMDCIFRTGWLLRGRGSDGEGPAFRRLVPNMEQINTTILIKLTKGTCWLALEVAYLYQNARSYSNHHRAVPTKGCS
jgi:hypothetical protein